MKYIVLVPAFLLCAYTIVSAETYKWEDKDGMHFTDNPQSIPPKYRDKAIANARGDDRQSQAQRPYLGAAAEYARQGQIEANERKYQLKKMELDNERKAAQTNPQKYSELKQQRKQREMEEKQRQMEIKMQDLERKQMYGY